MHHTLGKLAPPSPEPIPDVRTHAEVDAEIAVENHAIANIENAIDGPILLRTCAYCSAIAVEECSSCEEVRLRGLRRVARQLHLLPRVRGTEPVILLMVEELEHPLTPREIAVLRSLADGLNLGQTGERLEISRATVRTHVARVFAKIGAHTQAEAVAWAFRAGLIS